MGRLAMAIAVAATVSLFSTAQAEQGARPVMEITSAGMCGQDGGVEALRDELMLRLPELEFSSVSDSADTESWHLFWLPRTDGSCELILRSVSGQMTLQVAARPDMDELRFAASRLSWLVSVDDEDERAELFEELDESVPSTSTAESFEHQFDDARQQGADRSFQVADSARQVATNALRLSQDDAVLLANRIADEITVDAVAVGTAIEADIRFGASRPGDEPFSLQSHGTRVSLLPGVVVTGRHIRAPRYSINFIGRNEAFDGVEIGFYNHISWYGSGFQFGLIGNHVSGFFRGHQLSLLGNRAGDLVGLQASSGVNITHRGTGVQIGGLLNHAGDFTGVQTGFVNTAGELRGLQFGLINLSRSAWAPLGLISIALDYPPRVWLWYGAPSHTYVGVRAGGKYLRYGYVTGFRPGAEIDEANTVGLNIGLHIPTDPLFADFDLIAMTSPSQALRFSERGDDRIRQLRATLGWRILPHFAAIAGLAFTATPNRAAESYASVLAVETENLRLWPEFVAGVVF